MLYLEEVFLEALVDISVAVYTVMLIVKLKVVIIDKNV